MMPRRKGYDGRPRRHGWAPGNYQSRCVRCGDHFLGDKRAWNCADCAHSQPGLLERLITWWIA